jgi:3-oxoacyl-[acyl-carrier protein] reductase
MTRKRVALVTGSAGGIGFATAQRLVQEGFDLIGVDRVRHTDGEFEQRVVDLADPQAIEHLIADCGPVDVLVNNASVLVDTPLEDIRLDQMQSVFDVNLRAPVLLTRGFIPHMSAQGWGRIVNLSSVGARTGGVSDSSVYNMSKAGIASFTRFLARHYGGRGITANAIAPGGIETGMTAHLDQTVRERIIAQIPAGHLAQPTEVAGVVAFLVGKDAGFVNGVTLDVNGGWVMAP